MEKLGNREKVLGYLSSIAPRQASNSEIAACTGIKPHAQVFQITQQLLGAGRIRSVRVGNEWHFWCETSAPAVPVVRTPRDEMTNTLPPSMSPSQFEDMARRVCGAHFGTPLLPRRVPNVWKIFDLVSDDLAIVGDAKFFTLVRGVGLPPAKFSVIAEHVWLLEKTAAQTKFLVFGNDRRVPAAWLERYGSLARGVLFFFLSGEGHLAQLAS